MYQNNQNNLRDREKRSKTGLEQVLEQGWDKIAQAWQSMQVKIRPQRLLRLAVLGAGLVWLASGFYIVDEGNRGVETRFGAYTDTTLPGPHWHIPYPIEEVRLVNVAKQQYIEIGYRSSISARPVPVPSEALMLTRDENIVDVSLAIQYQIKDARDYLFNVDNPVASLKQASQSAERAVIGKNTMDYVLTEGRSDIVARIQTLTQQILDDYRSGISITSVNLQDAQPPEQVQAAFEDAIKAREDKQRLINEAQAYANEVLPKARGLSARKIEEAQAYKEKVIATATGDISRFNQLYVEYRKAPEVTRKRLLIEAMESVLANSDVVMLDGLQQNLLYLPLDKQPQSSLPPPVKLSAEGSSPGNDGKPRTNFQRPSRGRD